MARAPRSAVRAHAEVPTRLSLVEDDLDIHDDAIDALNATVAEVGNDVAKRLGRIQTTLLAFFISLATASVLLFLNLAK